MEALEAGSRHSASLPSISFLEADKMKRDEADYQRHHSVAAMVSPYSGPPPPYSHQTATSGSFSQPGIPSPPESRRTSEFDKEQQQQHPTPSQPPQSQPLQQPQHQPVRQSLPSIHEALGTDQSLAFSVPPPTTSSSQYHHQPSTTSPASSFTRPYATEAQVPPPPHSYSQPTPKSPYMHQQPHAPVPAPQLSQSQPEQLARHSYSASKLPALHPLRTANSPVSSVRHPQYSYPPQTSPQYEQPAQSAPAATQSFGYAPGPYPQGYPYSAPPPSASSAPFPPSTGYQPQRYGQPWRNDGIDISRAEESKRAGRATVPAFGESVKRHLESFDFEASLNEIADGSGHILDFSQRFGARAHQTQRSGPVPGSLPELAEVDALILKGQRIQDSLARIKEVVIAQQQAVLAEQAEQRFKSANGFNPEAPSNYSDDSKAGGFAGSDPKKRRGRAAPPGRCHSCNRAETPEWRRGPDGARTLCNACGLHYAKLTRKMGTNKGSVGSSNLRPKSLGPGSPT
ncbi:hypothetical protein K402DRAFT_231853 [Aulographum hederae CBS 113979]|uniref:GATA-type domain-containing protein n=1 Tax=Aulographum hederae CBS 113979 TaxID=1176131 RepID=A0A6G1GLF2_9PEZI|nr:hypothetical protein K402DRAFT_231853 [Aulographum hederae CBS 113979]